MAKLPTLGHLLFGTGRQIQITNSRTFVGRFNTQAEVDLSSLPQGDSVSHIHAVIELTNGTYTLTDLNSRNATFVNNQQLAPHRPVVIHNGDILSFGRVQCTFER